ncbi:response regulator transcription factor [bacterium]|nr:response regulator transcription factor [bacterium]
MSSLIQVYSLAGSAAQRQALERFLDATPGFRNLGSGNLSSAPPQHADIILTELLAGEVPQQPVQAPPHWVALLDEPRSLWVEQNWGRGLRAILPRQTGESELESALIATYHGLVLTHPEFLKAPAPVSPLSNREQEVLAFLALGRANKEIAAQMMISEHTVKFHLASIFQKLEASSRSEAVAQGLRRGLVRV